MDLIASMAWRDYLTRFTPSLPLENLRQERILVTGGSGFIGTNILEFYRRWGATVVNVDTMPPRDAGHAPFWHNVDICDASSLGAVIAEFQPTAVFHMAARIDLLGKTVDDYPENSDGVVNLIAALRGLSSRPRLLVASSRMVCDLRHLPSSDTEYAPSNPYGESKVRTEILTRRESGNTVPWVIVRPTGIWGPWFGVPYRGFFDAIRRGLYMHPRGRNAQKAYGFVGNMVFQMDRLLYGEFSNAVGRTVYCADPPVGVLEWSNIIADKLGVARPRQIPYGVLYLAAKAGDILKKLGMRNPPMTSFRLDNLVTDMLFDRMTAAAITGAVPFSQEDATAITCSWLAEDFPKARYGAE